jgi:hypothetical protein
MRPRIGRTRCREFLTEPTFITILLCMISVSFSKRVRDVVSPHVIYHRMPF